MARRNGGVGMTYQEPLSQKAVAISISESDDMAILGLAEEHLRDAMAEVARHLLAMGARLVYGGDLRRHGFTELLVELVARHRRDADVGDDRTGVVSYLPWPIHMSIPAADLRALASDLVGVAELHCLDRHGRDIPLDAVPAEPRHPATDDDWSEGLTAMRSLLSTVADARVVLGGRLQGFRGRMPGIAEEALLAFEVSQPVFLLGGFGGCARDIAQDLGLIPPKASPIAWPGRAGFGRLSVANLKNGLMEDENRTLARTVHVDEAVALILRGLLRLAGSAEGTGAKA
jgi:hypothetical protein